MSAAASAVGSESSFSRVDDGVGRPLRQVDDALQVSRAVDHVHLAGRRPQVVGAGRGPGGKDDVGEAVAVEVAGRGDVAKAVAGFSGEDRHVSVAAVYPAGDALRAEEDVRLSRLLAGVAGAVCPLGGCDYVVHAVPVDVAGRHRQPKVVQLLRPLQPYVHRLRRQVDRRAGRPHRTGRTPLPPSSGVSPPAQPSSSRPPNGPPAIRSPTPSSLTSAMANEVPTRVNPSAGRKVKSCSNLARSTAPPREREPYTMYASPKSVRMFVKPLERRRRRYHPCRRRSGRRRPRSSRGCRRPAHRRLSGPRKPPPAGSLPPSAGRR